MMRGRIGREAQRRPSNEWSETNGSICAFSRDCCITGAIGLCGAATLPGERANAGPDSRHDRARTIGGSHAGPAGSRTCAGISADTSTNTSAGTSTNTSDAFGDQGFARADFRPRGFETQRHCRQGRAQADARH
jgi:hypothetical protein